MQRRADACLVVASLPKTGFHFPAFCSSPKRSPAYVSIVAFLCCFLPFSGAGAESVTVSVDWNKPVTSSLKPAVTVTKISPSLVVVATPRLRPGYPLRADTFAALKDLNANFVRYLAYYVYPKLAVAELRPPTKDKTFWDFSLIDPIFIPFLKATKDHRPIIDFSTIPSWMFKTAEPDIYPDDPNVQAFPRRDRAPEVGASGNQASNSRAYGHLGTELVDPSGKQLGDYYARLISWYTNGGFTDENGKYHPSGYHYKFPWLEVLNEPDLEHAMTPEQYTARYDAIVAAVRKVSPKTNFVGLVLAYPEPDMLEYFLNRENHRQNVPINAIALHAYILPIGPRQYWQYSFFSQVDRIVERMSFAQAIRDRLSPSTRIFIDEFGSLAPGGHFGGITIPNDFWNLSAAAYAYAYMEFSVRGIDALCAFGLGTHASLWPSLSVLDLTNGRPNARYWVVKLLNDNFEPGDSMVSTDLWPRVDWVLDGNPDLAAQAYRTMNGRKKLLLVNKRARVIHVVLPMQAVGGTVSIVDAATRDVAVRVSRQTKASLDLSAFAVTVVDFP